MGKGILAIGAIAVIAGGVILMTRKKASASGALVYSNVSAEMVLQQSPAGYSFGTPVFNVRIQNKGTTDVQEVLALWMQSGVIGGELDAPQTWGNYIAPVTILAGETKDFSFNPPLDPYGGLPMGFKGQMTLRFWMVDGLGGQTPVAAVDW